jgi:excisionase family DNA binding protein
MAEGVEQRVMQGGSGPRFLTLKDVQEELQISASQALALVRSGELRAIQIGGRGQWRIERVMLEEFIAEAYRRGAERAGAADIPEGDD